MERREFIERTLVASAAFGAAAGAQAASSGRAAAAGGTPPPSPPPPTMEKTGGGGGSTSYQVPVTVERRQPGKPHRGKVFAAIQPHCDDIPIYAGGTVLKMIDEGYQGILITMSDDSMAGSGAKNYGAIAHKNEDDTLELTRRLGLKESIFLNYPNHNMDAWPIVEMRARLVFLFRAFKVDTVLVYDPSGLYERNPDHYVAARAVESACWMARSKWDYPEHMAAGVALHGPVEKYYFSRGPQLVNRVVDTSDFIDQKVWANMANVTQGPAGNDGVLLRERLAAEGKRLPLLDGTDEQANKAYAKEFALGRDRERGKAYGLPYAEYFHYIGPDESEVDDYIARHAVAK